MLIHMRYVHNGVLFVSLYYKYMYTGYNFALQYATYLQMRNIAKSSENIFAYLFNFVTFNEPSLSNKMKQEGAHL